MTDETTEPHKEEQFEEKTAKAVKEESPKVEQVKESVKEEIKSNPPQIEPVKTTKVESPKVEIRVVKTTQETVPEESKIETNNEPSKAEPIKTAKVVKEELPKKNKREKKYGILSRQEKRYIKTRSTFSAGYQRVLKKRLKDKFKIVIKDIQFLREHPDHVDEDVLSLINDIIGSDIKKETTPKPDEPKKNESDNTHQLRELADDGEEEF